jgi:predicted  nucleic acid-binding Zn-ribbon protein
VDPFFCDGCDMELSHDEIETVPDVPRVSLDRFEFVEQSAEVYRCGGCGIVIGYDPE